MRRTVIITGATKGLGREVALQCGARGDLIVGVYSQDETAAEALRCKLAAISSDSLVLRHDVRTPAPGLWERPEVKAAADLVLINNASAAFHPHPLHLTTWDDWSRLLETNVRGSWEFARGALRPMLRAGRGTIVNVLSAAIHGSPPKGFAAYLAAKQALRSLTVSLAAEYRSKGIRVWSFSPPFMETALTAGWDERLVAAIRAGSPQVSTAQVATRLTTLLGDDSLPGEGEDYLS